MKRIRRILHASDFSRASRAAFAAAVDMARANRAELVLVHVFRMPIFADVYISPKSIDAVEASGRAACMKRLAKLVAIAQEVGVRAHPIVANGVPHREILRLARVKHADLLVLGTHGRTGAPKFFLGSVAERVVSMAQCPVLTVRGK